jgi:hypothetical protein
MLTLPNVIACCCFCFHSVLYITLHCTTTAVHVPFEEVTVLTAVQLFTRREQLL